jgi:KaiC/GvpD/RAD55 family RecA-like ATPase
MVPKMNVMKMRGQASIPGLHAFLTDAIILQRYLEIDGRLQRVMAAVKVRASDHSKDLRLFAVTADGIVAGERVALIIRGC